jgi:hypothetical protein
MLMSDRQYRAQWEPQIADMHDAYFACIARGDESGARHVIIRANISAVPKWVWMRWLSLTLRFIDWLNSWG